MDELSSFWRNIRKIRQNPKNLLFDVFNQGDNSDCCLLKQLDDNFCFVSESYWSETSNSEKLDHKWTENKYLDFSSKNENCSDLIFLR